MNRRLINSARTVDVIVIGAGHAGLATSRCLQKRAIDHIVFERGKVADSWLHQRWHSLKLLTPNWMFRLPDEAYSGNDPDGFMSRLELVQRLARYHDANSMPVVEDTAVSAVEPTAGGYRVATSQGVWQCRAVMLATGAFSMSRIPKIASSIPPSVHQIGAGKYRTPDVLPDGGVLVVGASATGLQLAREINRSGRPVTLAVGEHVRLPRHYRGDDIFRWFERIGVLSESTEDVDDLSRVRRVASPQLVGEAGSSFGLNDLTTEGVELVGRLAGCDGRTLQFSGSLDNVCKLADLKQQRLLQRIDQWVGATSDAARSAILPTRVPHAPRLSASVSEGEIKSIVWATGFKSDYAWLNAPVTDKKDNIKHNCGNVLPGLYTLGRPFMRQRQSSYLCGITTDAEALSAHIHSYLHQTSQWRRGA